MGIEHITRITCIKCDKSEEFMGYYAYDDIKQKGWSVSPRGEITICPECKEKEKGEQKG